VPITSLIDRSYKVANGKRSFLPITRDLITEHVLVGTCGFSDRDVFNANQTLTNVILKSTTRRYRNLFGMDKPWCDSKKSTRLSLIEDERKAIIAKMERLALQAQIPLHLCVGSWAADHLSRIAWNNSMKETPLIVLDDVNEVAAVDNAPTAPQDVSHVQSGDVGEEGAAPRPRVFRRKRTAASAELPRVSTRKSKKEKNYKNT
jgi:hypothetical protein